MVTYMAFGTRNTNSNSGEGNEKNRKTTYGSPWRVYAVFGVEYTPIHITRFNWSGRSYEVTKNIPKVTAARVIDIVEDGDLEILKLDDEDIETQRLEKWVRRGILNQPESNQPNCLVDLSRAKELVLEN